MPKRTRTKLSDEKIAELIRKYHGQTIKCPKCGKLGRLDYRQKGSELKRYFYCRHGQEACYIATIEDIEEILTGKPTIQRPKYKQLV